MSLNSKIEWTDATWNPVTGCTPVSEGCNHCYALRMAKRLQAMGQWKYLYGTEPHYYPPSTRDLSSLNAGSRVFICSMGDLFHHKISIRAIGSIFSVIKELPEITFQLLTKRPERFPEIERAYDWPKNLWLGVTVELSKYFYRIGLLGETGAQVKFVSFEPLLGSLGYDLSYIPWDKLNWVIVGGETGPGARPMKEEWVLPIRDACTDLHIPFLFKQWGGRSKNKGGCLLQGREWKEMPK